MSTLLLASLLALIFGASGFWLRQNTRLTVVETSAFLTLLAGLILPRIFAEGFFFAGVCTAVSYAVMSSEKWSKSYSEMLIISFICACLNYFGQDILVGIGGRLGTSAALSVLFFVFFKGLVTKLSQKTA